MKGIKAGLGRKNFEDDKVLSQINQIFLKKRGYFFQVPKINDSIVLIISGGLDSIAVWNILLSKYKIHVYPVHFLNPSPRSYKGEEKSIKYYSKLFKKLYPKHFHDVEIIKTHSTNITNKPSSSDIVNDSKILLNNLVFNEINNDYKVAVTYNATPLYEYFFNAYVYAQKLKSSVAKNLNTIITCFVKDDTNLSRNSTLTVLRSINLSLCLILGDFSWQFTALFEKGTSFNYDKKSLIKYAQKSNVTLDKSWSCWKDGGKHCGICAGCLIRKAAFASAEINDETEYENIKTKGAGLRTYLKKSLTKIIERIKKKPIDKKEIKKHVFLKNTVFLPTTEISWENINNKISIFHNRGDVDTFNESGSYIWNNIVHGKKTFQTLLNLLKKKYKVKNNILKKDLEDFLNYCLSEGCLMFKK